MILQAILDRSRRLKDKSVSITFITSLEQTPESFMEIDKLTNSHGIVYFKSQGQLTKEEIDLIEKSEIEVEGKTKSQRLRNVLYKVWEQEEIGSFNDFYADEMERIITHYKSKLP